MDSPVRKFSYEGSDALQLPARREAFVTLQKWLEEIADELALPARTRHQLMIVADEIFTNIASYGYPDREGSTTVAVAFDLSQNELELTFRDNGRPYNPLTAPEPDLSKPPEERQIGGLGIFMVRKMMDAVSYRRDGECNVLTMTKKVS